jgi:hypothetical protein
MAGGRRPALTAARDVGEGARQHEDRHDAEHADVPQQPQHHACPHLPHPRRAANTVVIAAPSPAQTPGQGRTLRARMRQLPAPHPRSRKRR